MSGAVGLEAFAAQLGQASSGAAKIATSVVASGNVQAKTSVAVNIPGPALQSVLSHHTGVATRRSNTADASQLPAIADHMAADALRQGAELLEGN